MKKRRGSSLSVPSARALGSPAVQRLRRAATLTRQDAAARVLQQWWCVTHPPPVVTSATSFCEHAAALDVSEVVRLADLSNDSVLPGPGNPCLQWSWCNGEVWCRREMRGGTTTLSELRLQCKSCVAPHRRTGRSASARIPRLLVL